MASNKIAKRLDVLERMLTPDEYEPVHPPLCDCAIKSRDIRHHMTACPYRLIRELIAELRPLFRENS